MYDCYRFLYRAITDMILCPMFIRTSGGAALYQTMVKNCIKTFPMLLNSRIPLLLSADGDQALLLQNFRH